MKYKTVLMIIVFNIHNFCQANSSKDTVIAKVYYIRHFISDTVTKNSGTENMILFVGKQSSVYKSFDKMYNDSILKAKANTLEILDRSKLGLKKAGVKQVVKFYDKPMKMTVYDKIFSDYIIHDDLTNKLAWQITGETKTIDQLTVFKATCNFRGRNYVAWFCTDIAIQDGPWKFAGLPGLILEVYDQTGTYKFMFAGYQNVESQNMLMPELPAQALTISQKELIKIEDALRTDPIALGNSLLAASGNPTTITSIKNPDGTIAKPPKRQNNPIELVIDY